MATEGLDKDSWEFRKNVVSADFHPDPKKEVDPLETLVERLGIEGAFDELMKRLEENSGDTEARREADLLVNRFEDLASKLRGKIGH